MGKGFYRRRRLERRRTARPRGRQPGRARQVPYRPNDRHFTRRPARPLPSRRTLDRRGLHADAPPLRECRHERRNRIRLQGYGQRRPAPPHHVGITRRSDEPQRGPPPLHLLRQGLPPSAHCGRANSAVGRYRRALHDAQRAVQPHNQLRHQHRRIRRAGTRPVRHLRGRPVAVALMVALPRPRRGGPPRLRHSQEDQAAQPPRRQQLLQRPHRRRLEGHGYARPRRRGRGGLCPVVQDPVDRPAALRPARARAVRHDGDTPPRRSQSRRRTPLGRLTRPIRRRHGRLQQPRARGLERQRPPRPARQRHDRALRLVPELGNQVRTRTRPPAASVRHRR